MLIIGLTGSIATGKSTVSSLLSSPPYSLPIIDADLIARQVVEPGTPGYQAIVEYFGPSTPDLLLLAADPPPQNNSDTGSGSGIGGNARGQPLNRPALGRRVFGNTPDRQHDRQVLNGIVHPAVRWTMYKALVTHYLQGQWAVVLDVPLLFESGLDVLCGTVVVVGVSDPAVQMARLRARDAHLSAEDAENRVRSQGDVRGKAARAEFRGVRARRGLVVWNDGGREALDGEVRRVMREVSGGSPRWWALVLLLAPPVGVGVGVWNVLVNWWTHRAWERRVVEEKARL